MSFIEDLRNDILSKLQSEVNNQVRTGVQTRLEELDREITDRQNALTDLRNEREQLQQEVNNLPTESTEPVQGQDVEWSFDLIIDAALKAAGSHPTVISNPYFRSLLSVIGIGWGGYKIGKIHESQRHDRTEVKDIQIYLGLRLPMPEFIASPNYAKGRLFRKPKYVVVHSMAGSMAGTIATFKNPKNERSAHFCIGHDGRQVQMVALENTAWHAGVPFTFNNQDSIGIEHEGGTFPDGHNEHLGDAGYLASAKRIAQLHKDYEWGEPSEKTVKPHRALKATACPSGLDVSRLIAMAQEEYRPKTVVVPVIEMVGEPPVVVPQEPAVTYFEPFTVNLAPSQRYNADVSHVQSFLVYKKFMEALPANHWGYYGAKTQAAVHAFQRANGVNALPAFYGWWYDKTREAANKQLVK